RQPERTIDVLSKIDAAAAGDPAITVALATAFIESGRNADALQLVSASLPSAPEEPRYHFLAGRALEAEGKLDEAKREFNETLKRNARSSAALVELSAIAISQKRAEEGRELAQKALAFEPRVRGGHLFLA